MRNISNKIYFLTDESPFPPHDGRKVPVANYYWQVEKRGYIPEVIVTHKEAVSKSPLAKMAEIWARIRPWGSYYTQENISSVDSEKLKNCGEAILFVAPARLCGVAAKIKSTNPKLKIVLILNDAQWSMYLEAFYYAIGRYKGGKKYDIFKGLLTPTTFFKEMTAYIVADVVLVQTKRELARLPWLKNKAVIVPNSVPKPDVNWRGQNSTVFAMQVNFSNLRASKFKYFVTEVWPRIHAENPRLTLELFGPGQAIPEWGKNIEGVSFVGRVDDLDIYLSDKRGFLVPLEHSTGISNTVLRGIALDMPMVITETSSRGVKAEFQPWPEARIKIAKTADDFVNYALTLDKGQADGQSRQVFSWSENTDAILSRFDSVGK